MEEPQAEWSVFGLEAYVLHYLCISSVLVGPVSLPQHGGVVPASVLPRPKGVTSCSYSLLSYPYPRLRQPYGIQSV